MKKTVSDTLFPEYWRAILLNPSDEPEEHRRHIQNLKIPAFRRRFSEEGQEIDTDPVLVLHDFGDFGGDPILNARLANIFQEGKHT